MALEAHVQAAQATQGQIGIVRAGIQAQQVRLAADRLEVVVIPGDHMTNQQVRMAGDILGAGVNGKVHTDVQRPEKQRRGPGVVKRRANAASFTGGDNGRDILYLEGPGPR